jgi:SSS family solute:Na+ symporter
MNEMQLIVIGGVALYFLIMIFIGFKASKNQSDQSFSIGERQVGFIPTIGSLASSSRDGTGAVFWVGFGITVGYGGLWLAFGFLAGFCVYIILGPKIRKRSIELKAITVGEIIRQSIGALTEKLSAIVIVIFSLLIIAIQLYISGSLLSQVLDIPSWVGVLSVVTIVGFYLFWGGYSTVVKTDTIQFFLILSLVLIPFFIAPNKEDVTNFTSLFTLPVIDQAALFLIGFFYTLSSADTWQRLFSAKSDKVIRWSFPLAGVAFIAMTLSLIWLGMGAKDLLPEDINYSQALFLLFEQDALPHWVIAYIAIVVMAISMSSLDTFCYLFASSTVKNFLPTYKISPKNYIRISRVLMVGALILMSALALTISDVIQFLFNAASLLFVLTPIYIALGLGWFKASKRLDIMITISILVSVFVYGAMFMRGDLENMIMLIVPIFVSSIFVLLSVIFSRFVRR